MTQFVLSLLLAAGQLFAADVVKEPAPAPPPDVVIPDAPPPFTPPPVPGTAIPLAADQVLIVEANVPADVGVYPEELTTIKAIVGPVTLAHTKFWNGTGYETRSYADKTVYVIEPVGTGKATLVVWVNHVKTCRKLDVGGVGPGPGPTPPNSLTATFQAAYTADGGNDAKDLAFLASLYTQAAPLAAKQTGWKTNLDAATWLKGIEGNNLAATSLPKLREAIGAELMAALPPTQPADVNAISAELSKVGTALAGVK